MSSPGRIYVHSINGISTNICILLINSAPTKIWVKWLVFIFRYRRQNEKDGAYGAPVAEVITENNEATKEVEEMLNAMKPKPPEKEYKSQTTVKAPVPPPPKMMAHMEGTKPYTPKIKLVEEPAEIEPSEKPVLSTAPIEEVTSVEDKIVATTEQVVSKDSYTQHETTDYNALNLDFPNFFSRFKQIFGNPQSVFFVK